MKMFGINLEEGSVISNLTVDSGSSYPANPSEGELFYRTDGANEGLYVYDGGTWQNSAVSPLNVLKAGDTMSGNLTVSSSIPAFIANSTTSGNTAGFRMSVGGNLRWILYKTSTAESGSNIGSDLAIGRYNDAGTFIDNSFTMSRATGDGTFSYNLMAQAFVPTGSTVPANGLYLPAANNVSIATNTTERFKIDGNGNVGVGTTPNAGSTVTIAKNITGATTSRGSYSSGTVQSDVTTVAFGYQSRLSTQATSFTLNSMAQFGAYQGTIGAGSTVTTNYGVYIDSSLVGGTNNYGVYGNIPAASGRWNFYAGGTAQNYFLGNVGIGTGKSVPATALDVAGTVTATAFTGPLTGTATAIAGGVAGGVLYNSAPGVTASVPAGTTGQVLSSNGAGAPTWITNSPTGAVLRVGDTMTGALNINVSGTALAVSGATASIKLSTTGNIGSGAASYISLFGSNGDSGYFGYGGGANQMDIWNRLAGGMTFGTSNLERMRVDQYGNVGIATSVPQSLLHVEGSAAVVNTYQITCEGYRNGYGAGVGFVSRTSTGGARVDMARITADGENAWNTTTSTQTAGLNFFTAYQGSLTLKLRIRGDGAIFTGTSTLSPYNNTTGTGANLVVNSDGSLSRFTSSLKYKTDVQDYTRGVAEVMTLRPVFYKGINNGATQYAGLIAEEVHAAGLTEFVQYADDNSPDALNYSNMVALLVKAIQEQQDTILSLTARIEALEAP